MNKSSLNEGSSGRLMNILRGVLYCTMMVALAIVAYVGYDTLRERRSLEHSQNRVVTNSGLIRSAPKRLSPEYADEDRGLVADLPKNPEKQIDPQELVVAHYDGDEGDLERVDWEAFRTHLGQVTGKKVTTQPYLKSAEEVAAIKTGTIHIVALHAADTPYLVNNVGFVPVAVLGSKAGASGNHLVIAVSSKSKVHSLADVRGHVLTCTRPDSITGYRAAITALSHEANLLPEVDYRFHFSHGQKRSILGLIEGDYEIAALSADKIESMLADGSLKSSDYRVIYESQIIPRLTIGYVYNLKPELAAQVTKSMLDFDNAAASGETNEARMRFFAVDYKKDFAFPRLIDDSFDPRFGNVSSQIP